METKNLEQSKSHMFAASIFGVTSAIFLFTNTFICVLFLREIIQLKLLTQYF
ncbi:hypothetical protein P344_04995 [Spiroplasma mirum ATCC 29335]|uniref:Uncharacterized protein n=1 Tax=Spiroplasma mirum ATCC 29335 TaxID=838561 RepID=W6AMU7_9MOLU|nr:hypothetical protein P344_04995 [Spiroplasma mirum ATCC 29335]